MNNKYILCLVLISVVLISGCTSTANAGTSSDSSSGVFSTTKTCSDETCFKQYVSECKPAKFSTTSTNTFWDITMNYEIKENTPYGCKISESAVNNKDNAPYGTPDELCITPEEIIELKTGAFSTALYSQYGCNAKIEKARLISECPNLIDLGKYVIHNRIDDSYTIDFYVTSPDEYEEIDQIIIGDWIVHSSSIAGDYGYVTTCHKGSEEGENLNYYYCKGIRIEKRDVDVSGNILSSTTWHATTIWDLSSFPDITYYGSKCA